MQINLHESLFHPGLKTRGYQAPGIFTCEELALNLKTIGSTTGESAIFGNFSRTG